jgi:hypothetical protein
LFGGGDSALLSILSLLETFMIFSFPADCLSNLLFWEYRLGVGRRVFWVKPTCGGRGTVSTDVARCAPAPTFY